MFSHHNVLPANIQARISRDDAIESARQLAEMKAAARAHNEIELRAERAVRFGAAQRARNAAAEELLLFRRERTEARRAALAQLYANDRENWRKQLQARGLDLLDN